MISEQRFQIAMFEDDSDSSNTWIRLLEVYGHSVLGLAESMQEAERLLRKFKKLEIQIALVDGNLTEGQGDNREGARIVTSIHERYPQVVTIGIASNGFVPGAQYNFPKENGPRELIATLGSIVLPR